MNRLISPGEFRLGVRLILGATRVHILRTITGGAFVHLAIGGIFGTAACWSSSCDRCC